LADPPQSDHIQSHRSSPYERLDIVTYLAQIKQCLLVNTALLKVDLGVLADVLDDLLEYRALWQ
jgi:hypothetical protein